MIVKAILALSNDYLWPFCSWVRRTPTKGMTEEMAVHCLGYIYWNKKPVANQSVLSSLLVKQWIDGLVV